ncbi:MAG: aminopeptidase [Erysipelotrichaceae bacterium]|nr:aminopeptidase [Erysipelotrichaceae bacterium]
MKEEMKRKYAYTLARVGLNVQPQQKVVVEATIEGHDFVPLFAEECYKLGASEVIVNYLDLALLKTEAHYCPAEQVKAIAPWQKDMYESYLNEGACFIRLEGVNTKLMDSATEAEANAVFGFVDGWRNIARAYARKQQWCIAMIPTQAWAESILPDVPKEECLEKLWEILLKLCYITEDNDIVQVWQEKNARKREKGNQMDDFNLRKLHYTSSNGTDLWVGLTPDSKFGFKPTPEMEKRIRGNANIPTEEICTSPHKYQTEGVVYATRPLVLGGKKVENFGFRFHEGKVVEVIAGEGKEMLESLINTDEGACYLGEAALVEYDSPISQSGLVYYTTLIDENASCHLALGRALNGAPDRSLYNWSTIHIDFMIGAADTNIVGYDENGNEVQVFKDGNFAF